MCNRNSNDKNVLDECAIMLAMGSYVVGRAIFGSVITVHDKIEDFNNTLIKVYHQMSDNK